MKPVPTTMLEALRANDSVLILAHNRPDGDAIGSAIALGKGLKSLGKTVDYYLDEELEERVRFFPELALVNKPLKEQYDLAVLVDCSTLDYCYKPEGGIPAKKIAVIDHHKSNEAFGDYNFVEITAATGELIYRVLTALGAKLDDETVDAIFTAISTDTGSFQYSNVTAQTHEILAKLYELKGGFAPLSQHLHAIKSYNQTKLYGKAIDSLTLYDDGQLSVIELDCETIGRWGGEANLTDGISNIGMNTEGVRLAAVFKETKPGVYKVSLRSKDPYDIDVSTIAKKYRGGGHKRAAGFTYSGDKEPLIKELAALIPAEAEIGVFA